MKKNLRSAFLGTTVVTIGLAACDAAPPPDASVSPPVESEVNPAGEGPTGVVRDALADVIRDDDAFSRARRLGTLLPTLGPETVPAVKQILETPMLTLNLGAAEVELLLRYWATHQGEEASRWAVEESPNAYRIAAVFSTFTLWAEADPQAAVVATEEWRNRADVAQALQVALVLGWFAADDPPELRQFIRDRGVSVARQRALSSYIRVFIKKHGIEAVMRWAESVPDDDATYKTAVYSQVGNVVTMYDVEAGIRWCEAHCDGPHGKALRNMVASSWALSDPAAALEWLSNAPEGRQKSFATRVVFENWMRAGREAALDWMAAQTSGGEPDPWLQPILPIYVRALAQDSPADAIEWAERIEDDAVREFTLIQVARAWRRVDEAASEAWLLQSSLSEEAREEVRALQPVGLQRKAKRQPGG